MNSSEIDSPSSIRDDALSDDEARGKAEGSSVCSMKNKQFEQEDGFILPMFFHLFRLLSHISLFWVIRAIDFKLWQAKHRTPDNPNPEIAPPPKDATMEQRREWTASKPVTRRYVFPEAWALGNLIAAILAGTFGYLLNCPPLQIVLLVYAIERTFELFVYQVNVLLFDPLRNQESYRIKSATRMVLLLIMNMIEYTFWFSCIYSCLLVLFEGVSPDGFVFVLESFNFLTNLAAPSDIGLEHFQVLAFVETLVGMFMNLVCLARFIGLLPSIDKVDNS